MKYEWLIQNPDYLESRFMNQIYVMCLIYVLLNNLMSLWNEWNIKIDRLKQKYMDTIQSMINEIDDDYALKLIMFYPHAQLDSRPLITFI